MEEIDVGYMQVHFRLYANNELYASFAINAEDGAYKFENKLLSSLHEVLGDPAEVHHKIFQISLDIFETESNIVLHMPIHQSSNWEVIKGSEIYTIGFYCNLGEKGKKLIGEGST
jgi:hypothetical protein